MHRTISVCPVTGPLDCVRTQPVLCLYTDTELLRRSEFHFISKGRVRLCVYLSLAS